MHINRRKLILTGFAFGYLASLPVSAQEQQSIRVVKDRGCPCCDGWISHLRANDFAVTFEERSIEALTAFKREQGIPDALASCHTATTGGYIIEGHVPAADIRRLLAEQPDAIGLAVPGMPFGSPGMGPEAERQAYDVILIGKDGDATVFQSYAAAT